MGATLTVALFFVIPPIYAVNKQPSRHSHKRTKANKSHSRKQRKAQPTLSRQEVAKLLNWVPDASDPCNLCDGYFKEPSIATLPTLPSPVEKTPTNITWSGRGVYKLQGISILHRDVRVTQPGRVATADTATVYRSRKTGKITRVRLDGHVHLIENGRLIVSNHGALNLNQHTAELKTAAYHTKQPIKSNKGKFLNAWGLAKRAKRTDKGILKFWKATYTTCSPLAPTWMVHASYIELDKKKGVGHATNAVLTFKKIPIFYSPYYSFPLDHRRKSGFLTPHFGYDTHNGADLSFPLYWNMATNYDMTITPRIMTERGVLTSALFRYMNNHTAGQFYGAFIPNDRGFTTFKNDTIRSSVSNTQTTAIRQQYLRDLQSDSNNRAFFTGSNLFRFNEQWGGSFNLNYVTDPYYFRDFGNDYSQVEANQLLNEFKLHYSGLHWDATLMAQAYQTLHLIDQITTAVNNQYTRLPEIDIAADYPDFYGKLDFQLSAQFVNFLYSSNYYPVSQQQPLGQRLHIRPSISRSYDWAGGYIAPALYIDSVNYNSELATIPYTNTTIVPPVSSPPRPDLTASRNLPIVNIDSGLYFDRNFHFHNAEFVQTFEPRFFYLYVPYINQDKYPNFDTQEQPFTFSHLFALNRYTSYDRIQNANQISIGLSSRILRRNDASQILKMDVGAIYYGEIPRVRIRPEEIIERRNFSPIVGQLTYTPWEHWSFNTNGAWDPVRRQVDNAGIGGQYSADNRHIIYARYHFVHARGPSADALGLSQNTDLIRLGFSWGITKRWSILGNWYYNIARGRPESYFAGVQYDNCCFAVRVIANRSFTGVAPYSTMGNIRNQYRTAVFLQLQLKGLGSVGYQDPSAILGVLPGYDDPFKRRYI